MEFSERQATNSDLQWLWKTYKSLLKEYITEQWGWDESFQYEGFTLTPTFKIQNNFYK